MCKISVKTGISIKSPIMMTSKIDQKTKIMPEQHLEIDSKMYEIYIFIHVFYKILMHLF